MANYILDSTKAMAAKERIEASSKQINNLLQQYTQAKQQLLSSWEGSMKDSFVQQTGQSFENNCQTLVDSLKQLASNIEAINKKIIKDDIDSADIIRG